jgi:hypothetical protein
MQATGDVGRRLLDIEYPSATNYSDNHRTLSTAPKLCLNIPKLCLNIPKLCLNIPKLCLNILKLCLNISGIHSRQPSVELGCLKGHTL